ncbi:MAG: SDR family NAD(P)-dependent oxidoreductase [Flavobacteriia bacterium]|jgi:3-hydroxy acid dehydrogenase/malonic semialdehyde reductase|nr:SDR family NAD(P)-dependent oxidoreductase [Flavobacteriia bacterium]
MKYAIITGASSGFGAAIAKELQELGYGLVLLARRIDRLEELQKKLSQTPVYIAQLDVCQEEQVKNVISNLPREIADNCFILVNNAGLAVGRGPLDTGLSEDWNRMLDTNVKGLLYMSHAVIPLLKKHPYSHLINISSIAGKEVYAGGNVYCASKHAVDALSKALRIDLLPHQIKVSNIAPGAAETEFSLVRFKGDAQTAASVYDGFAALQAIDIAQTVAFIVSRPAHVSIADVTIMPTAQANGSLFHKK